MKYITDYQLDIDKGFQCKVNEKVFKIMFTPSNDGEQWFLTHQFEKLLIELELNPKSVVKSYGTLESNHLVYCDSKQECYDLCLHIVNRYFKPAEIGKDIISFRCGNESYKFELTLLAGKFMWKNMHDDSTPLINKNHVDVQKVKETLSIKIYTLAHCDSFGFDSREDALKFAKWVKEHFYDKQEWCEKSRRHLVKYYNPEENIVIFPNKIFYLYPWNNEGRYFWRNLHIGAPALYEQFKLTKDQVLIICSNLNLLAYFNSNVLIFENTTDAVKFTDYLIETYIIKKEKTYENQLRKERTAISRGTKPAGSIIHGRRSKTSVRCGCIEHKACLGS